MHRQLPFLAVFLLSLLGCDDAAKQAAKQHQADQAQNAAIVGELQEQGERLHNDQPVEPAIKDGLNDTP